MTQKDKNITIAKPSSYFNSPYLRINILESQHYGLTIATFIAHLSTYKEIRQGKFFKQTQKEIKEKIGISFGKQKSICDQLEKDGVLETKRIGIPTYKYYKINYEILSEIINNILSEILKVSTTEV